MPWAITKVAVLLLIATVSACAHTRVGPGFVDDVATLEPDDFTCCAEPEQFYPDGPVRAAFALAERIGTEVARVMYGGFQQRGYPGRLSGNDAAEAALLARLEPLDTTFTGNKSYIWGSIIPGRFTHDAIYLGTEAQLKDAGLWHLPVLAPLRDDIRAGRLFVEAVTPVSQTSSVDRVTESDAIAILRPHLSAPDRIRAFEVLADSIGTPYDFSFEVATTDRLSCTELVNLAMPGLQIRTRQAYGRTVIFPDEIVSQAIRGEKIGVVGYMVGTEDGFVWRNTQSLMADIAAYWGVPGPRR